MQYAIKDQDWPTEDELEQVLRCGNMLRPQQVFNPAWFSMETLEVVFKCPQETGEDGPYAALGHYWYSHELGVPPRPPTVSTYSMWEPCGKEVEEMLGLRCLEHEGGYYFFKLEEKS